MSYMTLSSQEKHPFLLCSYFHAHPTTLLLKILGDQGMGRPPPQIWGGPSPSLPRSPPLARTHTHTHTRAHTHMRTVTHTHTHIHTHTHTHTHTCKQARTHAAKACTHRYWPYSYVQMHI